MNINQTIISTLSAICPVSFHFYTGPETTYITFHSSGQRSALIADDLEQSTAHTVQIDIYSKGNINPLAKQTKALLKPYGFRRLSEFESFNPATKTYRKLISFSVSNNN